MKMLKDRETRAAGHTCAGTWRRGFRRASLALIGVILYVVAAPAVLRAAEGPAREDPFQGALFGAELVMRHQDAIGLTSAQRDEIVLAMQRMQSAVVPSQLSLSATAERLLALLRSPRVDVEGALAEVKEAMLLENRVKLEQVRFLIEVKNLLTAEQQSELDKIRARS
jgi:Spy/CpxP family protein refolding chaperone